MRKGKGLKIAALAGALSSLFAGAGFAGAPTGFKVGSFTVTNGDVTGTCGNTGGGYTVTCSQPIAVGKGFMQEMVSIKDPQGKVTQYIHTVVVDQNANNSNIPGAPATAGAKQFADESLVKYSTNQGTQTIANESGIWAQQTIAESAVPGNQNTAFKSSTELSMGWANPTATGVDAVVIKQDVNQANSTGGTTTLGNQFKTAFEYRADVNSLGTTSGHSTVIGQLTGLNNGAGGTEGDVQAFKLVQVHGSKNASADVTASLPNMVVGTPNTLLLTGGANDGYNQAMWLGQKISVSNTAGGTGATTGTTGAMEFGFQSFDNMTDIPGPIYYYSLLGSGPFQNAAGADAWGATGMFGTTPSLADPFTTGLP
ncbi:MAG: hypothetical protein AABY83_13885 [Pseudomonadota bacterium]